MEIESINTDKIICYSEEEYDFIKPDKIVSYDYRNYIPFGEDNLFPQKIAKLGREVANHRAILNSKTNYISGKNFETENEKLVETIKRINNKDEDLHDIYSKLLFDELNIGNSFFEIVTDKNKSFVYFYHIQNLKCRVSKDGKNILMHPDWQNYRLSEEKIKVLPLYPEFVADGNLRRSIIHIKQYEPDFTFYGLPKWYAGLRAAVISGLTNESNKSQLENDFSVSGMLIIPGVNTSDDAKKIEKKLEDYTGSSNKGKLFTHYMQTLGVGESREKAELIDFHKQVDGDWINLHKQSDEDLIKIHGWFRTLSGFNDPSGFDTNRIINEYKIALNTVIVNKQEQYLRIFKKLFEDFGIEAEDLKIINKAPISEISPVKFVWEVRKEQGLDYDETDPKQQIFYAEIGKKTF